MAEIYEARLEGIGGFQRTFAIKRILPHLSERPEFVDMLVEEAKVAGLLSHANIVQIMDLGQVDGTCFIAMEYVRGPDLGEVLARCQQRRIVLPIPHAVYICIEMLKALEYAHTRQVVRDGRLVPLDIVHRDVSPANILLSVQGEVKLTDFGIAKASVSALETVSGVIKGRFDYMSPEQSAGDPLDPRSDLFSTGVVLYQMLTGVHPFAKSSEPATLDAIRSGEYQKVSVRNPEVPLELERVLEKALAVDHDDRWPDATAMKDALDRYFHSAGFIFTHTTLAAYLKGLFPELAASTKVVESPEDDVTRPIPPGARLTDDEDRPTRVAWDEPPSERVGTEDILAGLAPIQDRDLSRVETQMRKRGSALDDLQDLSHSVSLGDVAGLGDESTLIRPGMLSSEDDWSNASTQIRPSPLSGATHLGPPPDLELEVEEEEDDGMELPDPDDWDDAETRIKRPEHAPDSLTAPTAPASPHQLPVPAAPRRDIAQSAPPPARREEPAPKPVPAKPAPPAAASPPTPTPSGPSSLAQVLYILGGAFAATGLVFVGAMLGVQYSRINESALGGDTPKVEVVHPEGATVAVNGLALPNRGPHLLGVGRHQVKVTLADGRESETWIVLEPREYRILTFETVQTTP